MKQPDGKGEVRQPGLSLENNQFADAGGHLK